MPLLVADHSEGAYAVYVPCLHCKKMLRLKDCIMDRQGPAFAAYYHHECAKESLGATDEQIQAAHYAAQERRLRGA